MSTVSTVQTMSTVSTVPTRYSAMLPPSLMVFLHSDLQNHFSILKQNAFVGLHTNRKYTAWNTPKIHVTILILHIRIRIQSIQIVYITILTDSETNLETFSKQICQILNIKYVSAFREICMPLQCKSFQYTFLRQYQA